MLHILELSYRIAGRLLFEGASVVLPAGSKTGLVGKNGSGKTTLFRLILKEISAESGTIEVHPRAKTGTVAQEAPGTAASVLDMVLSADRERAALLDEAGTASEAHRIGEIHTRLAEIDAHSAEARASTILKGLGFDHAGQARPCSSLSGGWRMRVALAGVLFSKPDLLLLDEPTNFLDLEGTVWLEKYLANYPHTVLMISHDRDLLNKAVTSIIHLDKGKLGFYRGAYDVFERTRRMQMEVSNKAREKTLGKIAHMQTYVDRFRYKANKAKQAQARIKAIAKLKPPGALFDETAIPFSFPQPKRTLALPMIRLEGVAVGYDGVAVLTNLDLRMDPDDRIALVGINGNGKSTFAKLLAGDLKPLAGKMERGRGLEVAYFAQHQMDKLRPGETPLAHVEPLMPHDSEAKRRSRLAQMGLTASRMDTKAQNLSGGEKARLLLGMITFSGPGLLILDEPTNHLDIDSRDALVAALNAFEGAVLVISHDRHLIEATMDRIWVAEGGKVSRFDGDIGAYQKQVLGAAQNGNGPNGGRRKPDAAGERKRDRKAGAARRAELAPLRKAIADAEKKISRLESAIERTGAALSVPGLFERDPERAVALGQDRSRFQDQIAATEEKWLEMNAELDAARKDQEHQHK